MNRILNEINLVREVELEIKTKINGTRASAIGQITGQISKHLHRNGIVLLTIFINAAF